MIIIHAHLIIKPDQREQFLTHAREVTKHSRAESGNISYGFFESTEYENSFVVLEKWEDQAAIDYHVKTPHFVEFMQSVQELLAEPTHPEIFHVTPKPS
ncbi:putative quinol monooxygenase [Brevibacillus dissolubilis]|uniref:putative quinol monooxygenase n=1 Tax=Brevibacillus dissolubilis TaxID=1844116 RepID=UPI001116DA7D|nr:putative quinol monooxygenase [Brevibacillus dissolubilis]